MSDPRAAAIAAVVDRMAPVDRVHIVDRFAVLPTDTITTVLDRVEQRPDLHPDVARWCDNAWDTWAPAVVRSLAQRHRLGTLTAHEVVVFTVVALVLRRRATPSRADVESFAGAAAKNIR